MYKKTIKLFLLDGEANKRVIAELSNWNGIAYRVPKTLLKECNNRDDLQYTGVYLLLGEIEGKVAVYIGEAENVYKRLIQHLTDDLSDFWNVAITFARKDNSLNKAHVKYLENMLYNKAKESNRYFLVNNSTPTKSTLIESEEAELEEMIDNMKMITNVLGYKVFEKINTSLDKNDDKTLYLTNNGIKYAEGIMTDEGFVILNGSKLRKDTSEKISRSLINYLNRERASKDINDGVFINDHLCSTPSMAGVVILGRNVNGYQTWRNKDGITLKEIIGKK